MPLTHLSPRARWLGLLGLSALALGIAACSSADPSVRISGEHDGLSLTADVRSSGHSVVAEAMLRNERDEAVYLVPDQCGRVIDAEVERTRLRPEGISWDGPLQEVKDLVLANQRSRQSPDSFHPREVGSSSSEVPACERPERVVRLGAGSAIEERWELPLSTASTLAEVGSEAARVTLEAVEARDPDRLELLDILPARSEDADRAGRVARASLPLASILDREATHPFVGPTRAELFDRLVRDDGLRVWIEAQPVDGWMSARLQPAVAGAGGAWADVRLRLVTRAYERAAIVVARPDGTDPVVTLPGEAFRTRRFVRRPGTLPAGIALIPEPDHYTISDDLLLGDIELPSGRVVIGEYLFEQEPLDLAVAPGPYPVHATLARYGQEGREDVSFVTLVLSDAPTQRWHQAGGIAVDGGTTTIVSPEGRDVLSGLFESDEDARLAEDEHIFDSLAAHDYLATTYDLTETLDLARVSSGAGDGRYPVLVGSDAEGRPTRVVVDFYLLHLDWPDP